MIMNFQMKKYEKKAEIKQFHIVEQLKKLYELITIIEKGYCKDRPARKQFRRDIINRGFVHATLMKRLLATRNALDAVLKINPEKEAKRQFRLIKRLQRKNKISKTTAKELKKNIKA